MKHGDTDRCPECGSAGVPVLFGLPTEAAREAGEAGRLVLAGCFARDDGSDPQWQCGSDAEHRWTDGDPDSPRWLAAIDWALGERPECPLCGKECLLLVPPSAAECYRQRLDEGTAVVAEGAGLGYRCTGCGDLWP